jgi:hypothetical protein
LSFSACCLSFSAVARRTRARCAKVGSRVSDPMGSEVPRRARRCTLRFQRKAARAPAPVSTMATTVGLIAR